MDLFEKTKKSKHVSDRICTIFIGKKNTQKVIGHYFQFKKLYTFYFILSVKSRWKKQKQSKNQITG